MIICKRGAKRSGVCENGQGVHYMTQRWKYVRGVRERSGGALYDTAMIICKRGAKTVRGCII